MNLLIRIRILLFIFLTTLTAQAKTDVYVLVNAESANFEGMNLKEMLDRGRGERKDNWETIVHQMRQAIIEELNENGNDWVFGIDPSAHYMATFVVDEMKASGKIYGRLALEYYRPHYHAIFYTTQFYGYGMDTRKFTRFSPKAFRNAAHYVKKPILRHLKRQERKRSYKK